MKSGKGFLLVFSITSPNSFRELTDIHSQLLRIKDNDPRLPMVLVGNKADIQDGRRVGREHAEQMATRFGNKPYYETSAKQRFNVDEVFVDLCRQMIRRDMEVDRDYTGYARGREYSHRRRRHRRRQKEQNGCVIL